jgi:predicted house-cleaning noncanonical NTP pyrophosphatase (MazG superfamily)
MPSSRSQPVIVKYFISFAGKYKEQLPDLLHARIPRLEQGLTTKNSRHVLRKLVRDRIPEEIANEGRAFRSVEVLGNVRDFLLRRKLFEEALELCNAPSQVALREELADVFEVLNAIAAEHRVPLEEIESIRIAKRSARGGFDRGVFIDYVGPAKSSEEIGLFGPMDYVSVTKRTPRLAEVKMDEEHLLRIPLTPSLYGEEFKVGAYSITYTEREVLVRILPEPDDRQLALFQSEPSLYDLTGGMVNLFDILPEFEGLWKIYSNVLLRAFRLPVPESILLRRLNSETERAVRSISQKRKFSQLLVRHDRNPEISRPPRGGYLIPVHSLHRELKPFFEQGRVIMLQEPLSPYNDLYSCNAILSKDGPSAVFEIVGPGFDASDLNRGDTTPHESWTIVCERNSDLNMTTAKRTHLVDDLAYQESVRKRLTKIGLRASGAFDIHAKKTDKRKSENQLMLLGKRTLKRLGEVLLLDNMEKYCPIGETQLHAFAEILLELRKHQDSKFFLWENEIVVSMSLLPSGRLVLWQIVWRDRKAYEPTREENKR